MRLPTAFIILSVLAPVIAYVISGRNYAARGERWRWFMIIWAAIELSGYMMTR